MNTLTKTVAAALTATTLSIAPAAAEDLVFNLVNMTDSPLTGLYVSHAGTSKWEENLLEGAYLDTESEVDVTIADGQDVCVYDVRSELEDGNTLEDYGIDLCELGEYELSNE